MRELTLEELELVAGGVETITVVAPPPSDGGDGGWGDGGYDGGSDGGGGGGGGDPPGDPPPPTFQDQHCAENAIKSDIAGTSDHNSAEHVSIAYKTADGQYHTSPVFEGTGQSAGVNQVFSWMTANGVSFSQVTDLYHNHDASEYGQTSDEAAANRFPSDAQTSPNGKGDWYVADYFVSHGADPSQFTMTIEDTTGVARDFAYSQESTFNNMSGQDMVNGKNLPAATTPCGS